MEWQGKLEMHPQLDGAGIHGMLDVWRHMGAGPTCKQLIPCIIGICKVHRSLRQASHAFVGPRGVAN